jgi:ferredoxin
LKADNTSYNKLIIYYFSGTGNAKYAAHTIADNASKNGIDSSVVNIADSNKHVFSEFDSNHLVGFCYPTYGFNAPPNMIKFIRKFPKGKADTFVLNTRAGMKLSKLHLPGIGGVALWLPAIILKFKGYKPIGFRPIDLPSNWISLHPGLRKKVKDSIVINCTKTLENFTAKIIQKKPVLNGFLWLPIDLALLPISFGYYFFGRFALSKTFFASYKCNNCNLCIKQCPVKAIKGLNNRPYWSYTCESCMKCMNNCPQRAIETAHGFTFLIWWLAFSLIPVLGLRFLIKYEILNVTFLKGNSGLVADAIMLLVGLPLVFVAYRILHYLLGFTFMNKLITWTSLTHWKFWRRYKFEDIYYK